jgi:hypothetical protein
MRLTGNLVRMGGYALRMELGRELALVGKFVPLFKTIGAKVLKTFPITPISSTESSHIKTFLALL